MSVLLFSLLELSQQCTAIIPKVPGTGERKKGKGGMRRYREINRESLCTLAR